MRRGNVTAGAPFTAALWSIVAMASTLFVGGMAVVLITKAAMYRELEAQIVEEELVFREILRDQGSDGLIETLNALSAARVSDQHIVGLFSAAGNYLAGDVRAAPDFVGWGVYRRVTGQVDKDTAYHANVQQIGAQTIVVGRNLNFIKSIENTLVWAQALAGIAIAGLLLAIGYGMSRRVLAKLETLAQTLDQVSRGDNDARLPVAAANDQVDRVAARMNVHLEQLSRLMNSTRNTIIAIAHDLKTPLNRAYLSLQKAMDDTTDQPTRDASLTSVEQELAHVNNLFGTILRIARIEAGGDQTSFQTIDAGRLIRDIAEIFEPVVEGKQQSLHCRVASGPPGLIQGDETMLRQMLVNLVENASRHCPDGTAIELSSAIDPDGTVRIEVADDGPGIAAEQRDAALLPHYRLGDRPGTGLGLSLVRAIVDRHDATLELSDNRPGLRVSVRFAPGFPAAA